MIKFHWVARRSIRDARVSEHLHYSWDDSLKPILEILAGEGVFFHVTEAAGGILGPSSTVDDLGKLTLDVVKPATDPAYIKDARPGQSLVVDILSFGASEWGWTAMIPGFDLLADQFAELQTLISKVGGNVVEFAGGARSPLRSFF